MIPFITEGSERTSYLTLESANQLIGASENKEDWEALDDPVKQFILIRSTLAIDGLMNYQGKKSTDDQILEFPRGDSTVIPVQVRMVTAILASKFSAEDVFSGMTKETIRGLSWEYSGNAATVGDEVVGLLRPFKARTVPFKVGVGYA